MMESLDVRHITKRMPHHGARAGYNQLLHHVPSNGIVWSSATGAGRWANGVTRRMMRPLTGSTWYGLAGTYAELRAAARARLGSKCLVHVMYGEDLLGLSRVFLGSRHRLIATFHQPPERFVQLVSWRIPSQLDAVIILDSAYEDWWRSQLTSPVYALSLGLDTEWWSSGGEPRRDRVIFVGSHLRDFSTLQAAVRHLGGRVGFDVVVPRDRANALRGWPGVTVHIGISDEALRTLYRSAAVMFLPLRGASASNSLLQAMACGCPVVATDLPSVRSCLGNEAGALAPLGDAEAHVRVLEKVLESPQRGVMSEAARRRGGFYSWMNVSRRHREVYQQVLLMPRL